MPRPKKDASAAPPATESADGAPVEKKRSQKEAVKLAMRAKGRNAPNDVLLDYIQASFGMLLKKQNIATLKSQIKSEGRRNTTPTSKGPEGYTLEDVRLMQDLVGRIGAKRVRDMVELFEK